MYLYSDNNALVGVIVAGNGNSDKSKVNIILDSPEPPAEIPRSNLPFPPKELPELLESIVASGTPGNAVVSSKTEPSCNVIV